MKAAELDDATDVDQVGAEESPARVDAPAKTSGRAVYSADVVLPGMLHAAVLRSRHPHARITKVDASAALELDGVHAVLTSADVPNLTWYEEETPFFTDRARFVGDELAAVAAVDPATARAAVEAIVVEYEPLDHATNFEVAAERDRWDDDAWSIDEPTITERGSLDVFDDAPVVVEYEFRTPTAVHNALEPHGCVAEWVDDRLTVHASTQGVNAVREKIAESLGLEQSQVRVVAEHVGGGFGAKQQPWKNTIIACLLARETGRPVRLFLDRRAENIAVGKRGATRQRIRLAANDDGELLGIDLDAVADGGAYRMGGEAADLSGPALHLYRCPNVRASMRTVYTHTGPTIAFRAPGYVEATFALESAMDELARRLEIDPVELRRRNYTERDQQEDLPWSSPDALRTSYDRVVETAGANPADPPPEGDPSHILRGRGFAAHEWLAGAPSPPGAAWMEMNQDGTVHAGTAAQDIGTGTRTALVQVVADVLELDVSQVRLSLGDTAAGPPAPTSAGSMTIPTMAPALRAAAVELRDELLEAAAEHLDCAVADLELTRERIVHSDGERSVGRAELLEEIAPRILRSDGGLVETADDVSVRTFGSAIVDVSVNTRTGNVCVDRVVVAPDCGRIVNRRLADSQVIGGVTQGIGFALTENQTVDDTLGIVVNPSLEDYLVPTAADIGRIDHAAVDLPDFGANALGVKGLGELPLIPVPAAIANAVRDALGIRFHELPITPKSILDALWDQPSDGAEAPVSREGETA